MFTGTIPSTWFQFIQQRLHLDHNHLTGTIPFHNSSSPLNYLSVDNNQLTGTIRTEIGMFHNLRKFCLHQKNIDNNCEIMFMSNSFCFPFLLIMAYTGTLNLYDNNLEGSIPTGKISFVAFLD